MPAIAAQATGGARPADAPPRLAARTAWRSRPSSTTCPSTCTRARCSGVVALEGQGQDELFDILAGSERPSGGELQVDGARGRPSTIRRTPSAPGSSTCPADRAEALLMQRSVRENIALPFTTQLRDLGPDPPAAASGKVDGGDRDAPDRHPRPGRGPPPVGRQPAEGHDRALGRGRRADDALLRPHARASTSAPSTRSTCCSATSPRRGPRCCCTRPSSRRSSWSATGRSSSSAAGSSRRSPSAEADEPTLLRAAYNLQRGRRHGPRRPDRRDGPTGAAPGRSRHRRPPIGRRPIDDRRHHAVAQTRVPCGAAPQRLDDRPDRVPGPAARVHQADPAELRRRGRPGPRRAPSCRWRSPPSARRSS